MAFDSNGNLYVTDMKNYRIQKFDNNGTFLAMWGSEGTGDGQFLHPHGIGIDSSDNVFVTDAELLNIQKFTNDGKFATKWGSEGTGESQFTWLESVDIDSNGNVYVADMKNDRIQKFTNHGKFLIQWVHKAMKMVNLYSLLELQLIQMITSMLQTRTMDASKNLQAMVYSWQNGELTEIKYQNFQNQRE